MGADELRHKGAGITRERIDRIGRDLFHRCKTDFAVQREALAQSLPADMATTVTRHLRQKRGGVGASHPPEQRHGHFVTAFGPAATRAVEQATIRKSIFTRILGHGIGPRQPQQDQSPMDLCYLARLGKIVGRHAIARPDTARLDGNLRTTGIFLQQAGHLDFGSTGQHRFVTFAAGETNFGRGGSRLFICQQGNRCPAATGQLQYSQTLKILMPKRHMPKRMLMQRGDLPG